MAARAVEHSRREVDMLQSEVSYQLSAAPGSVAVSERGPRRERLLTRIGVASLGLLVPVALLALWHLAAKQVWVPPQILPNPATVLDTIRQQVDSGELFGHFSISLARVSGGFLLGSLAGAALGVLMGLSERAEQYLYPSFKALSQVPVLGWLPLAMMVLGIGESLKVVIIASASLVPVAVNTLKGIRGVPRQYIEVARAYKFTHAQLLRKVILPGAVPSIFVGIRYGLTQAWLSLVTVELLASSEGLGFLIVWGRQLFQLDLVLAAIVVVGLVGLCLDKGLAAIEERLLRWQPPSAWAVGKAAR
jgi:sulfonate transport system permease protein